MLINSQAKQILPKYLGYSDATAGSTGDATKVTSVEIDHAGYDSALIIVQGTTTLAATETLSITLATTESATSGGSFTAKETLANAVAIATGEAGGSTEAGYVAYPIDIAGYDRYFKVELTPDLSAANTDTANLVFSLILCNSNTQEQVLATTF